MIEPGSPYNRPDPAAVRGAIRRRYLSGWATSGLCEGLLLMFGKAPTLLGLRPVVLATTLLLVFGTTTALGQRGQDRGQDRGQVRGQDRGADRGGFRGRGGIGGMGGMGRLMQPDFVRRDLTLIGRELDLDDDQSTIVEALLLDYQESFADGLDDMRSQFTEMRPQSPEDVERREQRRVLIQDLRKIRVEFQAEREQAGDDAAANEALREKIRARLEPIREQLEGLRGERPRGEETQWGR